MYISTINFYEVVVLKQSSERLKMTESLVQVAQCGLLLQFASIVSLLLDLGIINLVVQIVDIRSFDIRASLLQVQLLRLVLQLEVYVRLNETVSCLLP